MTSSPADRSLSLRPLGSLFTLAAFVIVWGAAPAAAQTFGSIKTYHVWDGHPAYWDGNLAPGFGAQAAFDGDGDLDTVISDGSEPTTLRLMTNNGSGAFSPSRISVSGATNSNRIQAADMNGDGKADIIVSNNHSRNVSVLLNTGNAGGVATFTTVIDLKMHATSAGSRGVAVGDLNKDGKPDVVSGDSDWLVYVFLNTTSNPGNATFSAPTYYSDGGNNRLGIAIVDLNKDGNNDVLVGNRDSGGLAGEFSVFLGNGTGLLTPFARVAGARGDSFATGDFNGDGNVDVATSRSPNGAAVAVFLGSGTGTFAPPAYVPTGGTGNVFVASADFNLDGKLDLVASNSDSHSLAVLRGHGDGTFGPATTYVETIPNTLRVPNQVLAGDVDGDGRADIASIQSNTDNLAVMLNLKPSDTTAPEIEATVTGVLVGGWYTSNVSVEWSVTDDESAPTASGCDTQAVTSDTAGETFTCTATSLGGTTTESVTIKRDTTGPAIASTTAGPSILWAPNNKMVPVTVAVSADDEGSAGVVCTINSVTSNEGGSAHEPDVDVTSGGLTVGLRAERNGGGSGRVYGIEVTCVDAAGNSSTSTTSVTVPHDKGKK